MYADIIIDITHEKLDKVFQYRITDTLKDRLCIGSEVIVPFGKSDRKIRGYVVGFSEKPDYAPEKIYEPVQVSLCRLDGGTGKRRGILSVFRKHVIMMWKK